MFPLCTHFHGYSEVINNCRQAMTMNQTAANRNEVSQGTFLLQIHQVVSFCGTTSKCVWLGGGVCVCTYVCVTHVKLQKFKTEEQPLELCGPWGILSSKKFQELCFQNCFVCCVRCVHYAGVVKPCETGQLGDPDLTNLANKPH